MATKKITNPGQTTAMPESIKYQRDKDREKVKGIFRFYEVPGGSMCFMFKAYKGDPIEKFTLVDGEVYEIPLGVARHLNKNGWYPEYTYKTNESGMPYMTVGRKVRRFGFQSLEFVDIDDLSEYGAPVGGDRIVQATPQQVGQYATSALPQ